MNAVVRTLFASFLVVTFNFFSFAQKPLTPPPPPQSPRQALIEIFNGGEKGLTKHLTVEVQELLSQAKSKERLLPFDLMTGLRRESGIEVETFDTGPVLLSVKMPKEHKKFEVNVNTDDLRGDQDTLELSFHTFQDGEEQEPEWQPFLSHFAVTLVKQKEIWRLSKISVGAEFAIGDAEFLKKTFFKDADKDKAQVEARVQPRADTDEQPQLANLSGEQAVMMLGFAESSFASQHPEQGFTCSLGDLGETANRMGLQGATTGSYKGYRITLTGCQSRPSGSFQITAEPIATGGKAYCTDATHNIRVSDDGRASTCLLAGRTTHAAPVADDDEAVGVDASPGTPAKPKDPQ